MPAPSRPMIGARSLMDAKAYRERAGRGVAVRRGELSAQPATNRYGDLARSRVAQVGRLSRSPHAVKGPQARPSSTATAPSGRPSCRSRHAVRAPPGSSAARPRCAPGPGDPGRHGRRRDIAVRHRFQGSGTRTGRCGSRPRWGDGSPFAGALRSQLAADGPLWEASVFNTAYRAEPAGGRAVRARGRRRRSRSPGACTGSRARPAGGSLRGAAVPDSAVRSLIAKAAARARFGVVSISLMHPNRQAATSSCAPTPGVVRAPVPRLSTP